MKVEISNKSFLDEVEKETRSILKNRTDIIKLIEICVADGKEKEFEDLIFTAKYIQGLMRVIKKAPSIAEVQSVDHVKNDFTENMKKVIEQIRNIINEGDKESKTYFEEMYLSPNQQSFENLTLLLTDLEIIKKYVNIMKSSS
jgi:hypothetical protein